jgi:protein SCO1
MGLVVGVVGAVTEHEAARRKELRERRDESITVAGGSQLEIEICLLHAARIIPPCAIIAAVLGGMLRVLVIGLVVLVAAMFLLPRGDHGGALQATTLLPEPRALPHVELVDATGEPLHLDEPRDEFTLLFFGYTNCPDVCPLTLKALAEARQELARRAPRIKAPRVVFVSVDPQRDTAARIAAYLAHFDAGFVGATATDNVLEPLLASFGVTVEEHRHDGTAPYAVVHSSTVYVLDPAARWVGVAAGPHDPAVIAADYLKIRQRFRAARPPAA